eukprot:scaffold261107_cov30-Tisochrysis_lutea.AAC.1
MLSGKPSYSDLSTGAERERKPRAYLLPRQGWPRAAHGLQERGRQRADGGAPERREGVLCAKGPAGRREEARGQ